MAVHEIDFDNIGASLKKIRDEARKEGFEAGKAEGLITGYKAALFDLGDFLKAKGDGTASVELSPSQPAPPAPKPPAAPKAPRGSVAMVVNTAIETFPLGFTVDQVMDLIKTASLPDVFPGSVRNHLRQMEKDKKVHRQGDRWHKGPTPAPSPPQAELSAPPVAPVLSGGSTWGMPTPPKAPGWGTDN